MTNSAYVTHSGYFNADEEVIERVKLATLLFDEIYWSDTRPLDFAHMTASVEGEQSLTHAAIKELETCWFGQSSDVPAYNIYNIDQSRAGVLEPSEFPDLFSSAKQAIAYLGLDAETHYDDYKLATYTMSEILYWRKHFPTSTFIGHGISDRTLSAYAARVVEPGSAKEMEVPSPRLFDVSWNDIAQLRRSSFLKAFRAKFEELVRAGQVRDLLARYQDALEQLADQVTPAPVKEGLIGVLANLPSPIVVNPFGIAASLHSTYRDVKRKSEFGWAFFIRETRSSNAITGRTKPDSPKD